MYICININSRVTELYHTLRSVKDNKRLLRVKIQNEKDTQVSLVKKSDRRISSQSKIVSHHSLTLETENKNTSRKHLTHFVELTHSAESCGSRYKAIFHEAVHPGRCGLATQSTRGLEKWKDVWSDIWTSSKKNRIRKSERATPV